jgi:adenylate cyclase class 2
MAENHVEIEAKVKVSDLKAIERRLQAAGGVCKSSGVYERNVRYEDANETLTPSARVLRLRQDTRARLTYKEPHEQEGEFARTELEVTVSDFETMDLLLQKLGFHPAWIYEKYRTTYELNGCEVVLDEMPFGAFIEVEGEPAGIERTLKTLNLADAQRISASYSDLFFRVKDRLGLSFRDLTFENFKDIGVPDEVFH